MATLPSGPLTVTQPGQASAMVGILAGALRDRSTTKAREEDPIDGLTTATTSTLDPTALATAELARPVTATSAADQKPLDMTQAHFPPRLQAIARNNPVTLALGVVFLVWLLLVLFVPLAVALGLCGWTTLTMALPLLLLQGLVWMARPEPATGAPAACRFS